MEKYIGYIYLTTNLVNGKKYIGQHQSATFDPNYKGSGLLVKEAFKKYGWHNFKCEVLRWCKTINELNKNEQIEIFFHCTKNPKIGYNLAPGGKGKIANKLTEEHKAKISKANKGQIPYLKGKHQTEEAKKKISEALKGDKNPFYGKKHSEESRKKMSEAAKGRVMSDENKQKLINANKGKPRSEETKRKISLAQKGKKRKPLTDEQRKHLSEINKGKKLSEETRKKLSEAAKIRIKTVPMPKRKPKLLLGYENNGNT